MTLDLRAVQLFALVGGGLQLKAAAQALHVSPSTASRLLQELEATLGVPLVSRGRGGRRNAVTDAGQVALRPARDVLQAAHRLTHEMNAYAARQGAAAPASHA